MCYVLDRTPGGKAVKEVLNGLDHAASVTLDTINHAGGVALQTIDNTITAVTRDPVGALLPIAVSVASGGSIPPYVTAAAISASRGQNIGQIATTALVSYGAQNLASTEFGVDTGYANVDPNYVAATGTSLNDITSQIAGSIGGGAAVQSMVTSGLNNATFNALLAVAQGKNVSQALQSGFVGGALGSGVNQLTNAGLSYFTDAQGGTWGFSGDQLKLVQGGINTALIAGVSGQDVGTAINAYVARAANSAAAGQLGQFVKTAVQSANDAIAKYNPEKQAFEDAAATAQAQKVLVDNYQQVIQNDIDARNASINDAKTYQTNNQDFLNTYSQKAADYNNLLNSRVVGTMGSDQGSLTDVITKLNDYQKSYDAYVAAGDIASANSVVSNYNSLYSFAQNQLASVQSQQTWFNDNKAKIDEAKGIFYKAQNASSPDISLDPNDYTLTYKQQILNDLVKGKDTPNYVSVRFFGGNINLPDGTYTHTAGLNEFVDAANAAYATASADDPNAAINKANLAQTQYNTAVTEAATRDFIIDQINTGSFKPTGYDQQTGVLDFGNGLTYDGKDFYQNGEKQFTNATDFAASAIDKTGLIAGLKNAGLTETGFNPLTPEEVAAAAYKPPVTQESTQTADAGRMGDQGSGMYFDPARNAWVVSDTGTTTTGEALAGPKEPSVPLTPTEVTPTPPVANVDVTQSGQATEGEPVTGTVVSTDTENGTALIVTPDGGTQVVPADPSTQPGDTIPVTPPTVAQTQPPATTPSAPATPAQPGISPEVQKYIDAAIAANPEITPEEISRIAAGQVAGVTKSVDDLRGDLNNAVTSLQSGTASSFDNVNKALDALKAANVPADQIQSMIDQSAQGLSDKYKVALNEATQGNTTALNDLRDQLQGQIGTNQQQTEQQIAGIKSDVSDVKSDVAATRDQLSNEIKAAQEIGLKGDAALQAGLNSLSQKLGTTTTDIFDRLNTTADQLRSDFSTQLSEGLAGAQDQIANLTAAQKQMYGDLSDAQKQQFDQLTAAQQAEALARAQDTGDLRKAMEDQAASTQEQIGGVKSDIQNTRDQLSTEIKAAQDQGMKGDAALQAGLDSLAQKLGTTSDDLLTRLDTTTSQLKSDFSDQLAGVQSDVASTKEELLAAVNDAIQSGKTGDAALQDGLDKLAQKLGTTSNDLLDRLGTTTDQLRSDFSTQLAANQAQTQGQIADVQGKLSDLNDLIAQNQLEGMNANDAIHSAIASLADKQATSTTDLLNQLGLTEDKLRSEFQTGQQETQGQIADLSATQQAQYDQLTQSQKDLFNQMRQQGGDFQAALDKATSGLGEQIGGVKSDLTSQITGVSDALNQRVNTLMQQGMDQYAALQQAQAEFAGATTEQFTNLGNQQQQQYSQLTQAQKDLFAQLQQQGADFQTALDVVTAGLGEQIGGVQSNVSELAANQQSSNAALNSRIDALMQTGLDQYTATQQALSEFEDATSQQFTDIGNQMADQYNKLDDANKTLYQQMIDMGASQQEALDAAMAHQQETFTTQIDDLNTQLTDVANQGNTNYGNLNTAIKNQGTQLTNQLNTATGNLTNTIAANAAANNAALQNQQNTLMNYIRGQQSFLPAPATSPYLAKVNKFDIKKAFAPTLYASEHEHQNDENAPMGSDEILQLLENQGYSGES